MNRTTDLLAEDLVDEAVWLDAYKSHAGVRGDRRAEVVAAAGPSLDLRLGTGIAASIRALMLPASGVLQQV